MKRHRLRRHQPLYFPGKQTVLVLQQQPSSEEKTSHGAYLMASVNTKFTKPKPPENFPENPPTRQRRQTRRQQIMGRLFKSSKEMVLVLQSRAEKKLQWFQIMVLLMG